MKSELLRACRSVLQSLASLSPAAMDDFMLQLKTDVSQCPPLRPSCRLTLGALSRQSTLADTLLYSVQINCMQ